MFQRQRDDQNRNWQNRNYATSNAVATPALIKCNICAIKKPNTAFSNIKLRDLAHHMAKKPNCRADQEGFVCCIGCSQKQVVELTCYFCGKTKGLTHFSKTQRKTPDNVCCWDCAKERENLEPGESDDDVSEDSRDGLSDNDSDDPYSFAATSSHAGGTTLPGTYSSRNTSGGGVSLPSTTGNAPSSSTGGWGNSSAASTTGTPTINGGGFQTVTNRASKPAASSRGGFNATKYKPASSVATASRDRGQWAKIPAVKKAPVKKDSDDESSDEDDVYLSGSD